VKMLLYLALLLAIAWLVLRVMRGRKDSPQSSPAKITSATSMYHAVSLKYSGNACDAAKKMTGRRFLSNAAPRLPLPECDALECRCQFVHHGDRRTGKDRRSPFVPGVRATGTHKIDRRDNRDRRTDDDRDDF